MTMGTVQSRPAGEAVNLDQPKTVLIAEVDAVQRDLLRLAMRRLGYEVITARDGAEALRLFKKNPPRLLLLDIFFCHSTTGWSSCASCSRQDTCAAQRLLWYPRWVLKRWLSKPCAPGRAIF